MSLVNNIINEFDIALKTLSNKKSGTGRAYPAIRFKIIPRAFPKKKKIHQYK
jgi:hypothetical protein